jgi:hypothetical protein
MTIRSVASARGRTAWRDDGRLTKVARKAAWTVLGAARHKDAGARTIYSRFGKTRSGLRAEEMVRAVTGSVLIEPSWGYVIQSGVRLFEESTGPNWTAGEKAPWRLAMPSIRDARAAAQLKGVRRYPMVISLRHWWEWNYFHFWIDVLGKLSLLASAGIDVARSPLVLGSYASELPFVRQLLGRAGLAELDWVVADGYIAADEVVYCKTLRPYRERLDHVMDLLRVPKQPRGERSLFIGRGRAATRRIANHAEVARVLVERGFEEVHPEQMSIDEQIATFSQASRVVAVHGAALVGLAFRRSSGMAVLELSGSSYGNDDYATLCSEYGYQWQGLVGNTIPGRAPQHADFAVDLEQLRHTLDVAFDDPH